MTTTILNEDLPLSFTLKYLGNDATNGLWGIKHTRKPVDKLVNRAKKPGTILPIINLIISKNGIEITYENKTKCINFPIETISYGVQDLVYTRVFSIIIVKDNNNSNIPFECHAFVCDSKQIAKHLTYTLANAFQQYSKNISTKNYNQNQKQTFININSKWSQNKFAIQFINSDDNNNNKYQIDSEA